MTVQGDFGLHLRRRIASVLALGVLAFAGVAAAPAASADPAAIPCAVAGDPITFGDSGFTSDDSSFTVTLSDVTVASCYDGGVVTLGKKDESNGYVTIDTIEVPAGTTGTIARTYASTPGAVSIVYGGQGTLGDQATDLAGGGTLDGWVGPEPCPVDPAEAGVVFDENAVSFDWSVPGELSVTLPPATRARCADSAVFVVVLQTPPTVPGGPSDSPHSIDVPIPTGGYAGGTVTLDIPFDARWEAYVSARVVNDGGVTWFHDTPAQRRDTYARAVDACVAQDAAHAIDRYRVEVTPGAGTIGVTVSGFSAPDCVESMNLGVWALPADAGEGEAGIEIGGVQVTGRSYAGGSFSGAVPEGDYVVVVQVTATVDGETAPMYLVTTPVVDGETDPIHVAAAADPHSPAAVQPAAVRPGRTLASTGAEPSAALLAGSALLALGLTSALIARRRRHL